MMFDKEPKPKKEPEEDKLAESKKPLLEGQPNEFDTRYNEVQRAYSKDIDRVMLLRNSGQWNPKSDEGKAFEKIEKDWIELQKLHMKSAEGPGSYNPPEHKPSGRR